LTSNSLANLAMVFLSSFSQWIFLCTISARLWEIPPYSWRVHINSELHLTSQKLKILSVMQFIKATSFRHVTSLHSKDTILDIPNALSSGFRTRMHSNRRSVSWLTVLQWVLVPQTDRLEPVSKTFAAKLADEMKWKLADEMKVPNVLCSCKSCTTYRTWSQSSSEKYWVSTGQYQAYPTAPSCSLGMSTCSSMGRNGNLVSHTPKSHSSWQWQEILLGDVQGRLMRCTWSGHLRKHMKLF
jgi:hypothetical protein